MNKPLQGRVAPNWWYDEYQKGDIASKMAVGGQGLEHPGRKFVLDMIPDGSSVLDVGCCNALMYLHIKREERDIKYCGVDFMPEVIDWTQDQYPEAAIYCGNANDLSQFNDNEFDYVVSRHVIDHLPYYGESLLEMYRVAKKQVICVTWHLLTDDIDKLDHGKEGVWSNSYGQPSMEYFINKNIQPKDYEITQHMYPQDPKLDNSLIVITKE